MKIQIIDIKDIRDFKLGNAENIDKGTGCTAIVCEGGAVGGVDVRGGGPATRETDLLRSENTVNSVNAVVLSGGSAFGLEAASGAMRELSERGIGFDTGYAKVPIVCGASLFDLSVGDGSVFPDVEMGREAVRNAYEDKFEHGNRGAGTGASVGKLMGMNRAMKTGLGTFACGDDNVQVGAVVAVNAVGDIYNGAGNIIAGLRNERGDAIYGTIKSLKNMVYDPEELAADAEPVHDGDAAPQEAADDGVRYNKSEIANAIKNAFSIKEHSNYEFTADTANDAVIPESAEEAGKASETEIINSYQAQEPESESIDAADYGEYSEAGQSEPAQIESSGTAAPPVDDDMGYDISFNTTISCLITNAELTKAQANKLASILHDAYARAIKPVHGTMDGDTVFVLSTCETGVNFDAFAALATDVLQYAIIDAATSARSAYGLPAECDITGK